MVAYVFKSILNTSHSNISKFCNNLPVKFAIFLKNSLLFNSLLGLYTKLYGPTTQKLKQLWMRKFQCLLFVILSYICYNIIGVIKFSNFQHVFLNIYFTWICLPHLICKLVGKQIQAAIKIAMPKKKEK